MLNLDSAVIGTVDIGCISYLSCLAEGKPSIIADFSYVWISSLDSNRAVTCDIPSYPTLGQFEHTAMQRTDRKIVVSGQTVVKAALGTNFFNGFDEVWCFRQAPLHELPDNIYIASEQWLKALDYQPFGATMALNDIIGWMRRSGAVIGLADGAHLNYVTIDPTCARDIESALSDLPDQGP